MLVENKFFVVFILAAYMLNANGFLNRSKEGYA